MPDLPELRSANRELIDQHAQDSNDLAKALVENIQLRAQRDVLARRLAEAEAIHVSEICLVREGVDNRGDYAVVKVRVNGEWIVVIREPIENNFGHYVNVDNLLGESP